MIPTEVTLIYKANISGIQPKMITSRKITISLLYIIGLLTGPLNPCMEK